MTAQLSLLRPPVTRTELYLLVQVLWNITIPSKQVCPEHSTPFDAFADAYFASYPVEVWLASRGLGGKSRTLAYLTLTEAAVLGADATILGGSLFQSQNVQEAMREGWMAPMAPTQMIVSDIASQLRLTNLAVVRPLTASPKAVRGPHPQRLRLDEVDEMELTIFEAALGQALTKKGIESQTVISSTHQHPDGTFTEVLKRADERDWPVHRWSVAEDSVVATENGPKLIQDVLATDRMLTRSGYRSVQHVSRMGRRQVLVVSLDNGAVLRLTPDHQVAIPGGWREAGELLLGDPVTVCAAIDPQALPAVSPVVTGGHVRVGRAVLMTARALDTCDLCGDVRSADGIDSMRDVVQVLGIHAGMHPAQVVETGVDDVQPGEHPVAEPVRERFVPGIAGSGDDSVSGVISSVLPYPALVDLFDPIQDEGREIGDRGGPPVGTVDAGLAPSGPAVTPDRVGPALSTARVVDIHHGAILPVWDIGVEGDHEFVVNGIVVHNCWKETSNDYDGWLTPDMIERKRTEISAEMWRIEFDLQEPSVGNRAFDSAAVEKMFRAVGSEVYAEKSIRADLERYEFEAPRRDGAYVIAADWAKEQDFTVISVWDTTKRPAKLVYYYKARRRPYPVMVKEFNDQLQRYYARGIHDATGVGNAINDYLDSRAQKFIMVGRERDDLLSEYVAAVERGDVVAPMVKSAYTAHLYCTVEDLYYHREYYSSHLPDEVCSFALAWHLAKRNVLAAPSVVPRNNDPSAMMSDMLGTKLDQRRYDGPEGLKLPWKPEGEVSVRETEMHMLDV